MNIFSRLQEICNYFDMNFHTSALYGGVPKYTTNLLRKAKESIHHWKELFIIYCFINRTRYCCLLRCSKWLRCISVRSVVLEVFTLDPRATFAYATLTIRARSRSGVVKDALGSRVWDIVCYLKKNFISGLLNTLSNC